VERQPLADIQVKSLLGIPSINQPTITTPSALLGTTSTLNIFVKAQAADRCARNAIGSTSLGDRPQSNNGMHPTADTPTVIYPQRLGAAGDAGR
jgi:hypothetical protein